MATTRLLLLTFTILETTIATDTIGEQLTTFLPPETVTDSYFGGAIAISNNVVIGSSVEDEGDGSVSIYEKGNSLSEAWPATSVYPPEGAGTSATGFGVSVAIESYDDGMVAFVGAPKDSTVILLL